MKPGIYDISNEEYHSGPGISRSGITLFNKSALHYWNRYINNVKEDNDATHFVMGNAMHTLILEPDYFYRRYFILQKLDMRTKVGRQLFNEMTLNNKGKKGLTEDQFQTILHMKKSLETADAIKLIEKAQYEQSIYWEDSESGVLCKCRPDILRPNAILDIKTTADASSLSFQRDTYRYGYHIQAAMMQDGVLANTGKLIEDFIFIAIEKEEPYAIGIYLLSKEAIEKGRQTYKDALIRYKECLDNNNWPGYEIKEISLPAYAA